MQAKCNTPLHALINTVERWREKYQTENNETISQEKLVKLLTIVAARSAVFSQVFEDRWFDLCVAYRECAEKEYERAKKQEERFGQAN